MMRDGIWQRQIGDFCRKAGARKTGAMISRMPIKFKAKSKQEIPLYVEEDGGLVLDVEGAVDKTKLDEFRTNNIALSNQLAETKRWFEGIESEQVRAVAAERDALNARLTAIQVDQGVVASATKKGLRPSAI